MRVPATESESRALLAKSIADPDEPALCAVQEPDDETADLTPTFQAMSRSLRALRERVGGGAASRELPATWLG